MSLYERVADLPLTIDGYALEGLARTVSSRLRARRPRSSRLHGGGEEGLGEDVTYDGARPATPSRTRGPVLAARRRVDVRLVLASTSARSTSSRPARRARPSTATTAAGRFESAALDLALRQAGTSLPDAARPRRRSRSRSSSPRGWASRRRLEPVDAPAGRYPGLRFKLDATPDWSDELIARCVETGAVDSIDFKGAYKGTVGRRRRPTRRSTGASPRRSPTPGSRTPTSRRGGARRARAAPGPDHLGRADPLGRRTSSTAPVIPRTVNLKPSRFGSCKALFEAYEFCEQRGMGAYGGGQYELGVGRGQIQLLAALFHPDAPERHRPRRLRRARSRARPARRARSIRDPAPTGFRRRP